MRSQDFIEESKNLKRIINDIDIEIDVLNKKNNALESEMDPTSIFDYDDAEAFKISRDRLNRNKEEIDKLSKVKKEPYFFRIDLEESKGTINSLFIGKEGLFLNHEQRVVDWRTDLGNLRYSSNAQKNISINGFDYSLILKREMNISNSELILCKTLYDAYDMGSDSEIVDSFLIEVLKDKRRDKKVTDIIKTIQSNQNEILRLPIKTNFVIQGCAGSGKTMILLHRLSYILFNKLKKESEIRIITPNLYFDSQIDPLSSDLGINSINRMTVDQYYSFLIEKVTGNKIDSAVMPEYTFETKYLAYIYSNECVKDINVDIDNYIKKLEAKLNEYEAFDLFKKANFQLKIDDQKFDTLLSSIKTRIRDIKEEYNKMNEIVELKKSNKNYDEKCNLIIKNLKERIIENINKKELEINAFRNRIDNFVKENESIKNEISAINETINSIKYNKQNLSNYVEIKNLTNEIGLYIKEKCKDDFDRINNLYNNFNSFSIINFIKRRQIRQDIARAEEELIKKATRVYEEHFQKDLINDYNLQLDDLKKTLSYNEKTIDELNKKEEELITEKSCEINEKDLIEQIKKPTELFAYLSDLNIIDYDDIKKDYPTYEANCEKIKAFEKTKMTSMDATELNDTDISKLNKLSFHLRVFNVKDIEKELLDKYLKETAKVYRHSLYIKLLIASLLYDFPKLNEELICFDEAQDISQSEYELLYKINNKKSVYNFYGDTNQAVNNYENIENWKDDLNFIDNLSIFELSQNYRNSYQITDYCNNVFKTEIAPIGIKGDRDVIDSYNFSQSLQIIKEIFENDKEKRCAIIYSENNSQTVEIMKEFAEQVGLIWNSIKEKGIHVLPLRLCKGLEFDAVMVMDFDMSSKEKYISYTRALDNLVICSSKIY